MIPLLRRRSWCLHSGLKIAGPVASPSLPRPKRSLFQATLSSASAIPRLMILGSPFSSYADLSAEARSPRPPIRAGSGWPRSPRLLPASGRAAYRWPPYPLTPVPVGALAQGCCWNRLGSASTKSRAGPPVESRIFSGKLTLHFTRKSVANSRFPPSGRFVRTAPTQPARRSVWVPEDAVVISVPSMSLLDDRGGGRCCRG